ncbi:hypothetical protein [Cellulomonas aerilata]|uniref:DUF306 domain-containing protein n=1 Tax=Cellulomonas aerilata TaxID=515326 RepID=A0A512DBZ1_9CELL|nr:hypothetical protein [Cellulomonas aerilata]GEO33999.1 hypothetical protein CAE01nite_17240 [Cellulomonas aerilata]
MKRSLRALAAVATGTLLLAGCATGDTGHLDPEISPDLGEVRSSPVATPESDDDEGSDAVETPAPGASGAPANDVEAEFAAAAGSESWYAEVESIDPEGERVLVTTRLEAGDEDAVAVCEAAFEAASATGVNSPTVEVRASDGSTLSLRDTAAGDEACSRAEG